MDCFNNDWKSDLTKSDNGLFRTIQLEVLEKNISGIDISILIALENKCFDLSDSKEDYSARLKKLQESLAPIDLNPIESPKKQQPEPESDIEIIETPKDLVQEAIRLRQNWLAHNSTDEIIGEGELIPEIAETKPLILPVTNTNKSTENERERQKRLNSKSFFDMKQKRRFRG